MPQTIFVPTPGVDANTFANAQPRGSILLDPDTKSTFTNPVVFEDTNACGTPAYEVGTVAVTINQNIQCVPTLQAVGSLKVTLPIGATTADFDAVVNLLRDNLRLAMIGSGQ